MQPQVPVRELPQAQVPEQLPVMTGPDTTAPTMTLRYLTVVRLRTSVTRDTTLVSPTSLLSTTDALLTMAGPLSMTVVHHVNRKVTLDSLRVRDSMKASTEYEILVRLRTTPV